MVSRGWRTAYFTGSTARLMADCKVARPTMFPGVPRIYTKLYDAIMSGVAEKGKVTQMLFNHALRSKIKKMAKAEKKGVLCQEMFGRGDMWDKIVFKSVRETLGGEVMQMWCGSAYLDPKIALSMKALFGVLLFQGYGMTESSSAGAITRYDDSKQEDIGHLLSVVEGRVCSLPDHGYDACPTDGSLPKGELRLKGPVVLTEYHNNPEATAAAFDEDGYYRTGDCVQMKPDGEIRIIGRASRIIKLQQGEFINLEAVEDSLSRIPIVSQVFVTADRKEAFPVAVVIPDPAVLRSRASAMGISETDIPTLCADERVVTLVRDTIAKQGREMGLFGFQVPREVALETVSWETENNFLTATFKKRRATFDATYESTVATLYAKAHAAE
ncbi:hypothetical protein KIPB_008930 [Kipferlia bialata]|uniref:AMP-dependent synthetase/ligase domain-containing protein n=1 Tax=Kipferlia bialata TaxID=797122 RepID=A0A9K3D0V5_9EUKA|nr:hypothetical protein KIPB_008930 [Kipferlia bialata]|eukprot:g8930.t1